MRFFKNLLFSFVFFFLLSGRVLAVNYPDAYGHVNDYANIFSTDFKTNLETKLVQFTTDTTNEIAVVTIPSLEGISIEEYAVKLFEKWAIGKKAEDNGLLLLIAPNEKKVRIEVGYGLEPVITDGRAGEIIRMEITPEFKNGNYEAGVQAAVDKLMSYIKSPADIPLPPVKTGLAQVDASKLIFVFFIFIYLASFLSRTKEIFTGGIAGFIIGLIFYGFLAGIGLAVLGFILDLILSKNYKKLAASGKPTSFWSSGGGFKSGGGGGGFGGFGGGSSGGGGASGSW